jgi:hypothetical protein
MLRLSAHNVSVRSFRCLSALAAFLVFLASPLHAQVDLPPVKVGGGLRTSFVHTDPDVGTSTDQFLVNSARIYVNGSATEEIKFMFNTEYQYSGNTSFIGVLDAAARVEVKPEFNIWMGRFLPPSDRANMYGPYYAHHWNVFSDGVQNGQPSITIGGPPSFTGRANGIVYWGDFKEKVKFSIGAFDGSSLTGKVSDKVLTAARLQIDFWDAEGGYYLNGTYYGDKNLLAIGGSTQVQSGKTASNIDFLMEKKMSGGGVISLEGQYTNYNRLGGYVAGYKSQGAYGLASYLFPQMIGKGQIEVLGKYGSAQFTQGPAPSFRWETTEINVSYVIKQFNSRVVTFFQNQNFTNAPDTWKGGLGLQIQM